MADLPKSTERSSTLNRLITCHRHFKTDIIILSQCFKGLNTIIRKNYNIITAYPSVNKQEMKCYYDELNCDEGLLENLFYETSRIKYGNLTVNFIDRHNTRYFINFVPVKIN